MHLLESCRSPWVGCSWVRCESHGSAVKLGKAVDVL